MTIRFLADIGIDREAHNEIFFWHKRSDQQIKDQNSEKPDFGNVTFRHANVTKFCSTIDIDVKLILKIQMNISKTGYFTEQSVKWRQMLICKIQNGLRQYLDTDEVSSLPDQYNWKRHFIRARPESRFYENLVCIVLIIGPELNIMKKSFTTRESAYIEIILHKKNQCPRLKACA